MSRTYSYTGLPAMNPEGNAYVYTVEEIEFTVGTGEDAVTYHAERQTDGSYVVTIVSGGADAEMFTVTQDGNNLINAVLKTSVSILKVDDGSGAPLKGAKFRLLKLNGSSSYVAYNDEYSPVEGVPVGDDGTLTFSDLPNGEYQIIETQTPPGYVKRENNDIFFRVMNGVVTRYDSAVGTEGRAEVPAAVTEGEQTLPNVIAGVSYDPASGVFTVRNTSGTGLPHTGSSGVKLLAIFGGAMTVLGGAGLEIKRRKERE